MNTLEFHLFPLSVPTIELLRTCLALHYRIHSCACVWSVGYMCEECGMHVCGVWDACVWSVGCMCVECGMHVCGVWDACVWSVGCMCVECGMTVELKQTTACNQSSRQISLKERSGENRTCCLVLRQCMHTNHSRTVHPS